MLDFLTGLYIPLLQGFVTVLVCTVLAFVVISYGLYSKDISQGVHAISDGPKDRQVTSTIDHKTQRITTMPPDASTPPATLLKRKWNVPAPVAKELCKQLRLLNKILDSCYNPSWVCAAAAFLDLILRDFIMAWYSPKADGSGMTDDSQFLEYIQYIITNAFGNLSFRSQHVNPVMFILEDVTEAVRYHMYWYDEMRRRAHVKQPDLFVEYSEDQLATRGASRHTATLFSTATSAGNIAASRANLVAQEKRWIADQQERATLAEYAACDVLHPASAVAHSSVLGSEPSPASWAIPRPPSVITPPDHHAQQQYLRGIVSQLLSRLLPENEYLSTGVQLIVREIVATSIMFPCLNALDPDMINWLIEWGIQKLSETSFPQPVVPSTAIPVSAASVQAAASATTSTSMPRAPSSDSIGSDLGHVGILPDTVDSLMDAKLAGRSAAEGQLSSSAGDSKFSIPPIPLMHFLPTTGDFDAGISSQEAGWPFFHGPMSRHQTEALLVNQPVGSFLFRSVEGGKLVLSWVRQKSAIAEEQLSQPLKRSMSQSLSTQVAHTLVHLDDSAYFILGRGPFDSLAQLLRNITDCVWTGVVSVDGTHALRRLYDTPAGIPTSAGSNAANTTVKPKTESSDAGKQLLSTMTFGIFNRKPRSSQALLLEPAATLSVDNRRSSWFARSQSKDSLNTTPSVTAEEGAHAIVCSESDVSTPGHASAQETAKQIAGDEWVVLGGGKARTAASSEGCVAPVPGHEGATFVSVFKPLFAKAVKKASDEKLPELSNDITADFDSDEEREVTDAWRHKEDEDDTIPLDLTKAGNVVQQLDDSDGSSEAEDDDEDEDQFPVPSASAVTLTGPHLRGAYEESFEGSLFGDSSLAPNSEALTSTISPQRHVISAQATAMTSQLKKWKRKQHRNRVLGSAQAAHSDKVAAEERMPTQHHRVSSTMAQVQMEATINNMQNTSSVSSTLGLPKQAANDKTAWKDKALIPCEAREVASALLAYDPPALVPVLQPTASGFPNMASLFKLSKADSKPAAPPTTVIDSVRQQDSLDLDARVVRVIFRVDDDATAVVRYLVEVSYGPYTWSVKRRFSEFLTLHKAIRDALPEFPGKFPPKKTFLLNDHYNEAFVEERRATLNTWLQDVLLVPDLLQSKDVRMFLAPGDTVLVMKRMNKSQAAPPQHEAQKKKQVSFGSNAEESQEDENESTDVSGRSSAPRVPLPASAKNVDRNAGASAGDEDKLGDGIADAQSILTIPELRRAEHHIFHLLNELFDLHSRGWMRRQLVGITRTMFRYFFSGSAAVTLQSAYSTVISAEQCAFYVQLVRDEILWPNGTWKVPGPIKTWEDVWAYRLSTQQLFIESVPAGFSSLLGKEASDGGMLKLHSFLQVPALSRSLLYTLLDLLLLRLFPGIVVHGLQHPPPATRTSLPVAPLRNSLLSLPSRLPIASLQRVPQAISNFTQMDLGISRAFEGVTRVLSRSQVVTTPLASTSTEGHANASIPVGAAVPPLVANSQ